ATFPLLPNLTLKNCVEADGFGGVTLMVVFTALIFDQFQRCIWKVRIRRVRETTALNSTTT
ncbi:MAG: hypothetical protein IJC66_01760, partial [Kiritimatiellae bacterium]|nr:hypothetical protein [Kiritimatiellia bacterium]